MLFSFVGGTGHAEPLLPIARAAEAAGHAVAFTAHADALSGVTRRGFAGFPVPPSAADGPRERRPLLPVSAEREDRVLREVFAGRLAPRRAAAMTALCATWRPDVVVCDEGDFGAMVAAEALALPHAVVLVIAAAGFVRPEVVAEPLDALRAAHGLPPDPGLAMLRRDLVLSPFPPGYRDPGAGHALRPSWLPTGAAPPAWLDRVDGAVAFSLGTVFNLECGDLFARVLAGLRELPVDVVATVGEEVDPDELGEQPARVHVERWIDQPAVLSRCRAAVSHGGSGGVMGALAHGLPLVLLPMGADQPLNARRCEELGVARVLDAVAATPADVRDAVAEVLAEPGYRSAAERLRDEIAALPGPASAVPLLERLAA